MVTTSGPEMAGVSVKVAPDGFTVMVTCEFVVNCESAPLNWSNASSRHDIRQKPYAVTLHVTDLCGERPAMAIPTATDKSLNSHA